MIFAHLAIFGGQTIGLPPTGIQLGSPASQHINFIGNRSKMTCSKMQNAKAETKIEGVDAGLNQKLGLGSSQALALYLKSFLNRWKPYSGEWTRTKCQKTYTLQNVKIHFHKIINFWKCTNLYEKSQNVKTYLYIWRFLEAKHLSASKGIELRLSASQHIYRAISIRVQ